MTKESICLVLVFALADSVGLAEESPDPIRSETGRLQEFIGTLASSDYVLGEPAVDARAYVAPGPVLHAFSRLATDLAWGDVRAAAAEAAQLDYEVVEFVDATTHRKYFVLREDLSRGQPSRGWGSYIINRDSQVDAIVEVPHPVADAQTPEIGAMVFEQANAKGFLLAGAHRLKADVPDLVDSVFHQVHAAWIGPAAQVAAWQIHGFSSSKHSFPDDADVIASTGDGVIAPEVENLDAMFENQGLRSYVFNNRPAKSPVNERLNGDVPGVTFTSLAATTNEQGRYSRRLGGSFVHVELESQMRLDAAQRERAAAIIAAAMDAAPARPSNSLEKDRDAALAAVDVASHADQGAPAPAESASGENGQTSEAPAAAVHVAAKAGGSHALRVEATQAGHPPESVQ